MGYIQIRIKDDEKKAVQEVFDDMGMTMSGAIKLFIRKTIQEQRLPFDIVADTKRKKISSSQLSEPTQNSQKKSPKEFTNFVRKTF